MLEIAGAPLLDKQNLIGGCVRLPVSFDAARFAADIAALPAGLWGTTGGRVGVHRVAEGIFLRGYAPAEGERPIEDRPALASLPYARFLMTELIRATALRCLLARVPAGASVAWHVDRPRYFGQTLRLHFPVETHDEAWMVAGQHAYRMRAGEVWALNNSAPHAVWNAHPTQARTHMICDFLPSPRLLELLCAGERSLGRHEADVFAHLAGDGAPATTGSE